MQRFFDIVFSGAALLVLTPLLVPIMIILRFTGEGEIFYVQQRIGKGGEPFGVIKFVTMLKNSESMGTGTVTVKDDPRVLPFGKFLRRSKINELPQLFNIFLGSMSVIGPRPQTQRCFDAFPEDVQSIIVRVRPGLSGIGSIVFRNEDQMMDDAVDADRLYDEVIMRYKGACERWYAENHSLYVYFATILLTVWVVLTGKGEAVYKVFPSLPAPPSNLEPYIIGNG